MMKKSSQLIFLLVAMLLGFANSAFATRAQYDAVSHSQPVNVEGDNQVLFNLAYGGFLCGSNENGIRASLTREREAMMLQISESGSTYTFGEMSPDAVNNILVTGSHAGNDQFTIMPLGDNMFKIGNTKFPGKYLAWGGDWSNSRLYFTSDGVNDVWVSIDPEEYNDYDYDVREGNKEYYAAIPLHELLEMEVESECSTDLSDCHAVYDNPDATVEQLDGAANEARQRLFAACPDMFRQYTLTECRKFTDVPTKLDARQSMLLDGKLYIKVKGTVNPQIFVYDATGLDTVIATPGANTTNICHDDAGNIIYRQSGAFSAVPSSTEADVLGVITPDGERHTVTLPLAGEGLPATKLNFYSDVVGNILKGEAYFFYPERSSSNLYIVTFNNGVVNPAKCGVVALNGAECDEHTKVYPFGEGKFIFYHRGADPIIYTYAHNGSNWNVADVGSIYCPDRFNTNGLVPFTLDNVDYIAYPSGSGCYDGFSIAKLPTDGGDAGVVAVFEETTTAQHSGFQTTWLHAEVVDDNSAVIYQYFPGGWVKAFRFTAGLTTPDEYPAQIYMAGSYNNWNYASCTTLAQDNDLVGLYRTSAEIAFGENAAFAISEANGEEGAFNAAKWGVASDTTIVDQQPLSIVKGGENISIVSGNHMIIVDLLTQRVSGLGDLPYKKENKHHHTMTLVADTVMPTDEVPGLLAYWQCTGTEENPGCMLYFADSLGTDTIGDATALAAWLAGEAILPVTYNKEDRYVVVTTNDTMLVANTKYLSEVTNVTVEGNNSLLLIFREGTASVHVGDTIAIPEADLKSVEMKKGDELTPQSATTGTAKRTGDIDVNWIQLWENGPKFAEYNVGAASIAEYGEHYCWGSSIDKDTNGAYKSGTDPLSGNDDTATNLWGNNWRMLTSAELQALLDNCDVEWTTIEGVNGRKYTGRGTYSANSIFLPATGFGYYGALGSQGSAGMYWSSTPNSADDAFDLFFDSADQEMEYSDRYYTVSVRPVLVEE